MANSHSGFNKSLILLIRTQDRHYARVELIPQPAGSSRPGQHYGVQTVGGREYKFVDVRASYQLTNNLGYASRPSQNRTPAVRKIGTPKVKN